jgi:initiation factor 1A
MPNIKGGKSYKKTKHGVEDSVFIGRAPDQMYGRVIKNLGGMNLLVFCNDNYERICHIRGSMQRRGRLREGDIVILSLRDFYNGGTKLVSGKERGDIVTVCEPKFYSHLRKDETINQKLFIVLEVLEEKSRKALPEASEGGFDFGYDEIDHNSDEDVVVITALSNTAVCKEYTKLNSVIISGEESEDTDNSDKININNI